MIKAVFFILFSYCFLVMMSLSFEDDYTSIVATGHFNPVLLWIGDVLAVFVIEFIVGLIMFRFDIVKDMIGRKCIHKECHVNH